MFLNVRNLVCLTSRLKFTMFFMPNEIHVSKSGASHLSLCMTLLHMYDLPLMNFDGIKIKV